MASTFKIYDGQNWVDPCNCNVNIRTSSNTWKLLDPRNCLTKYWTGTEWCRVVCPCECPTDYVYNVDANQCELKKYLPAEPSTIIGTYELQRAASFSASNHGASGVILYEDITTKPKQLNGVMINAFSSTSSATNYKVVDSTNSIVSKTVYANANALGGTSLSENRVYQSGIWSPAFPNKEWLSFEYCVNITEEKQFMVALAGDNQLMLEVKLDGQANYSVYVVLWSGDIPAGCPERAEQTFKFLHVFPIIFPAGNHKIRVSGMNCDSSAGFSAEIYDRTYPQMQSLMTANASSPNSQPIDPYIVFTTKSFIVPDPGPYFYATQIGSTITWSCLQGTLNTCNGVPSCYIEDTVGCGEDPNELVFNFVADYIILEYKFLKPGPGEPADYWPDGNGGDIYDTQYTTDGGITYKSVRNDLQGIDLDTHTRLYGGPDENTFTINSQYKGYNSTQMPYPLYDKGTGQTIPIIDVDGTIPLSDQAIIRHSGDNVGTGFESVLINVKEFKARFGPGGDAIGTNAATQIINPLTSFGVEMRAWWFKDSGKQPTRYPVAMRAKMYKSTTANPITAVGITNYVFYVTGGEELIKTTPPVIVCNDLTIPNIKTTPDLYYNTTGSWVAGSSEPDKRINVFNYNAYTGAASFVNNNTTLVTSHAKIPSSI